MWIQATLHRDDFARVLGSLLPLRIELDPGAEDSGVIYLGRPKHISIVAQRGVRLRLRGQIQWPVLGVAVPVTLREVQMVLEPHILGRGQNQRLAFIPVVEQADVNVVPGFVERWLIPKLNKKLASPDSELAWKFMKTLHLDFPLPVQLSPAHGMGLRANWGAVKVTRDALTLAISLRLRAHRSKTIKPLATDASVPASLRAEEPPASTSVPSTPSASLPSKRPSTEKQTAQMPPPPPAASPAATSPAATRPRVSPRAPTSKRSPEANVQNVVDDAVQVTAEATAQKVAEVVDPSTPQPPPPPLDDPRVDLPPSPREALVGLAPPLPPVEGSRPALIDERSEQPMPNPALDPALQPKVDPALTAALEPVVVLPPAAPHDPADLPKVKPDLVGPFAAATTPEPARRA